MIDLKDRLTLLKRKPIVTFPVATVLPPLTLVTSLPLIGSLCCLRLLGIGYGGRLWLNKNCLKLIFIPSLQQLLFLWDRIFAYDSMELLAGALLRLLGFLYLGNPLHRVIGKTDVESRHTLQLVMSNCTATATSEHLCWLLNVGEVILWGDRPNPPATVLLFIYLFLFFIFYFIYSLLPPQGFGLWAL